jgi:cobalt-zinc-cadmium resistance protein CzcA
MREAVDKVPGVSELFTTPLGMRIDEGLGGTPADVSVRIFGPDPQTLADLADAATAVMRGVRGMTDVRAEPLVGLPQLTIQVDRDAAARVGLTPGDVIEAVQIGLTGQQVSEVWVGQRRFDLVVKLSPELRRDAATLSTLMVDGHDGSRIPLGKLATLAPSFGLGTIKREAGSRRIAIEATVTGRDLGSAAAELRDQLRARLSLPPGYFVDVGGKVESQSRAQQALHLAIALALLGVLLLLYIALGSRARAGACRRWSA